MKHIIKFNNITAAKQTDLISPGLVKVIEGNDEKMFLFNYPGLDIKFVGDSIDTLKIKNVTPLSFTADGEASTISLTNNGGNTPVIYYSFDRKLWNIWDYSSISLSSELTVYMYGDNSSGFSSSSSKYSKFVMAGKITANGNILSLISLDCPNSIPCGYCYSYMFYGCSSLTSAPELPATTLANNCYWYMFRGCSSLTSAPELPATTLANNCYSYMFFGCSSLTSAPELPATTLANYCYYGMFYCCSSLTSAPELPATTLADGCYNGMFYGCSSLTSAPELPATTLANYCYNEMFSYCSKLNYVKCLATTNINTTNLSNWLSGVASTGTFVKCSSVTYDTSSVSGIPSGWIVETASN